MEEENGCFVTVTNKKDRNSKKTKSQKSDEGKARRSTELQTFEKGKDDGAIVEEAESSSSDVKKRKSSWRRSFSRRASSMFTRTPPSSNIRNDKVPVGKQGGGLLKKKARDTILSVLTKKQTQEKQVFPERGDRPVSWGPELGVDTHSKATRPLSVMVKSSTTFSSDRDVNPADSSFEEPEIVSVRTHPVYKVRAKVIDEEKVNSIDPNSTWTEKHKHTNEKDDSSRRPPTSFTADLSAPDKISPTGVQSQQKGEAVTQGSVTTAYNTSTTVKAKEPQSPKKEVNLAFQVPVDKQAVVGKSECTSPVWASSVNVWVPFQVIDGNEAAPVSSAQLDSSPNGVALTETEKNKDGLQGEVEANSEVVRETVVTSTKDDEVKMTQTISASSIGESNFRVPVTSTPVKPSHGHTANYPPPNPPGKIFTKSGSRERIFEPTMQSSQMFTTDLSPVENHSEMPDERRKKTTAISELTFTIDEESPLNKGKDQVDCGQSNKPQVNSEKKSKEQREILNVTRTKPRSKSTSAADSSRQVSTQESDGSKKVKPHKDSLMITRGKIGDNSRQNSSTLPRSGRKLSNSVEALAVPRRKSLPAVADKMPTNKKDKSPNGSPKPSRRFGTARDIIKSRSGTVNTVAAPSPSSSRKQRPQSDPLPGEKTQPARKQSSSVFSKFSSGKSKTAEIEALKLQLKQFGDEKESLREKIVKMETQLEIIPVLEKEKLVMERQMNDVVQEREKVKLDLKDSNESLKKLETDVKQLSTQQQLHLEEIEKGQVEMDAILDEKLTLEKAKISLDNDKKQLCQQLDSHLENLQKVTKEKDKILSEKCTLKTKLEKLLLELGNIRKSVIDLKENNMKLRTETVENDLEVRKTLTCCVTTFQSLTHEVEKQRSTEMHVCATSQTDNIAMSNANTQTDIESDNLSDRADITNEEYDDLLEELEDNKEEIEALQKKIKKIEEENNELVEKFEDAELELENLRGKRQRKDMSDSEEETQESSHLVDGLSCEECQKLREALDSLKTVFCIQQSKMEKLSEENEILEMERSDFEQESNYLKNVLSYRKDVQDAQTSFQKNKVKKVEQLESNLDDAEHKVRELEDEVYRLHKEKQTLLMSILNLNDEDGADGDGKESVERKESDTATDIPHIGEGSSSGVSSSDYSPILIRTEIPVKTEPEGSELNNDGDTEIDVAFNHESKHLKDQIKKLQEENENLKSSLANNNREVDFVDGPRAEMFEGENKAIEERTHVEKNLWNAQLKAVEEENKNLKESLLRVEDEKMALIKCLEMGSAGYQTSSPHTSNAASPIVTSATEDEDREISRDASYIQSIVGKLRRLSMTSASEYESEIDKSGGEELEPGKRLAPEGSPPSSEKRPRDGNELARIVASLETDLGKLKKHMYKKDHNSGSNRRGSVKGPKGQMLRRHSTVHEINFAKTNLERVYREKRHLKDEVDSLRRCLNSSHHTRRRVSVVETHHATIKTFDDLLQKSDLELRESNAKVARLELMNADTEEKLREAEALGEDLRKAVVISNNIATEEKEKAEKLEEEKSALLALVQQLTLSRMGGSIEDGSDPEMRHARSDDECSEGDNYEFSNPEEVGSEPETPGRKKSTERERSKVVARDRNGNLIGRQISTESGMSNVEYEDDRQSRHSSFADVSELDSDESVESDEEESNKKENRHPRERNGDCSEDEQYSINEDST